MMGGQYDALVAEIAHAVQAQLEPDAPRALLIGPVPPVTTGYRCVSQPPYEAVLIGALSVGQLLHFTCEPALQALIDGKPVLLWSGGLPHRSGCASRGLYARCLEAERELMQLGVRFLHQHIQRPLITAQQARQLQTQGAAVPPGAVLTPLARDILEGKA